MEAENTAILQAPPSLIGRVIGQFRLVTELGNGGMGTVYYAEHVVIGRRAAIKVLHPQVAQDADAVARFLDEARAVNAIRHPNVVEITDIGRHEDLHYIIMNLLEGETLGERLERRRILDEKTALRIGRQVAMALEAAHERGVIHRDLKPDNVFLTNHPDFPDYVKVLDFGIAKLTGPMQGDHRKTAVGMILGTPAYMSPEQCRGLKEIDARSDIYSLGVMLYEMFTGKVPFVGADWDVIIAHATAVPMPPIQRNEKMSRHLNAAILRALEKDPAKRFAHMRDFVAAFEDAPPAPPEPVAPVRVPAAAPGPAAAAAPAAAPPGLAGARVVAAQLIGIIKERITTDRLLLPAMPTTAIECMRILRDPRQTFKTVGTVISKDPVLASRILKLANSAAFPGMVPAATVEDAVARMGIEGLNLALVQFSMYQAFTSRDERIRASFRGIWEHSLAVALMAKELAQAMKPNGPNPSTAYLSGLLHDVGKPVVATLLLEAEKLIGGKQRSGWMTDEVWRHVVNESHRSVGVMLGKNWNLPPEVLKAMVELDVYDTSNPRACSNVVRLANALAKRAGLYVGQVNDEEIEQVITTGCQVMGISPDVVAQCCRDLYKRVDTLLNSAGSRPRQKRAS